MNRYYDIIPTPKMLESSGGDKFFVEKLCFKGDKSREVYSALSLLKKECNYDEVCEECADLVIYPDIENAPCGVFDSNDIKIFNERFACDEGYVIKRSNGKTVIGAKQNMGAVYGIVTLLQMLDKPMGDFIIRDWPDFKVRGNKWTIWAETGIWSYDFGDGAEAIKKRFVRKLDMLFKYKINYVHADGFGFDADRFCEYADIMRTLCDEAIKRGIHIATGGYTMSYGMTAHLNSYQGKSFLNRKSYPDGEVYECIGSYMAWKLMPDCTVARDVRLTEMKGRINGTCLSNDALFEEKMKEICDFVRRTHVTALGTHNMDAYEIHPELWMARCENCRKKWPNDDLFARDGCAGAFAEFIDKLMDRIRAIKDGDFDGERDVFVRMSSPGYLYANQFTEDPEFVTGVKFWGKVAEYIKNNKNFIIGFREQFFCHESNEPRVNIMKKYVPENVMTGIGNFCGADGYYDEKLFATTTVFNYIMKGYSNIINMNGNAFQEPLQIYNAEYSWNSENSGFYNIENKPESYDEFMKLYYDMMEMRVRPDAVFGDGGFIDIICEKLYGEKYGREIAKVYKIYGENGEPPIACASNVDIYTNFSKVEYPMRWANEMDEKEINQKLVRFTGCAESSKRAYEVLSGVLSGYDEDEDIKADLTWLCECFYMGSMLTARLRDYMELYREIDSNFRNNTDFDATVVERISALQRKNQEFKKYVENCEKGTIDKFGGSMVRRVELAEFLEYNTSLMLASINEKSRIPKDLRPERIHEWW